jgi:hypothetical protein
MRQLSPIEECERLAYPKLLEAAKTAPHGAQIPVSAAGIRGTADARESFARDLAARLSARLQADAAVWATPERYSLVVTVKLP